jgi:hypothetical protein
MTAGQKDQAGLIPPVRMQRHVQHGGPAMSAPSDGDTRAMLALPQQLVPCSTPALASKNIVSLSTVCVNRTGWVPLPLDKNMNSM